MLNKLMERKYVFFDGGMGTMLLKYGMKPGERSDLMNMKAPESVEEIQRQYAEAGSDIICTNSFSACSENLKSTGYSAEEVIGAAVAVAKRAGGGRTLTALDIGPIGEFMEPYGDLTYERAYERFREQAVIGEAAGADLVAIETMSALDEMRAAITAVHENTKLSVFASMTFDKNGRTLTGAGVEEFAEMAEELGVTAVGINCSYSPEDMFVAAGRLAASTSLPIIIKLNAGLPHGEMGLYDVGPDEFARQMEQYKQLGVKIVGGCCGTTPDHIRALKKVFGG